MLRLNRETINELDQQYPGFSKQVEDFEAAALPNCESCGLDDVAQVQVGMIGRTSWLASATTKFKLIPNRPKPGRFFCHDCQEFFENE